MRKLTILLAVIACFNNAYSQDIKYSANTVPIADVHMHVTNRGGSTPANFVIRMKDYNVQWGGAVGDFQPEMHSLIGNRYIGAMGQTEFTQILGQYGQDALTDPTNPIMIKLLSQSEEGLINGTVKGFGELHTDNMDIGGYASFKRRIPTDNPAMRKIYEVANKYNAFVQIHGHANHQFAIGVKTLAGLYPNTTTIISHCLPGANTALLTEIFDAQPNIVCELSAQGPVHGVHRGRGRVFNPEGIDPNWKDFIIKYQDRIMVGTDPCCQLDSKYTQMIKEIRSMLLANLPESVMEKLAYKNAVRIMKLQ